MFTDSCKYQLSVISERENCTFILSPMWPYIYLRDSCDRIGMRVHQSSVRYTVHQPVLKTHILTPGWVWFLRLVSYSEKNPKTFPHPFLGRPTANHGVAPGGTLQREPQLFIMAVFVGILEPVRLVHTAAEVLAGLGWQAGVHVSVRTAHSEGDRQDRLCKIRRSF